MDDQAFEALVQRYEEALDEIAELADRLAEKEAV